MMFFSEFLLGKWEILVWFSSHFLRLYIVYSFDIFLVVSYHKPFFSPKSFILTSSLSLQFSFVFLYSSIFSKFLKSQILQGEPLPLKSLHYCLFSYKTKKKKKNSVLTVRITISLTNISWENRKDLSFFSHFFLTFYFPVKRVKGDRTVRREDYTSTYPPRPIPCTLDTPKCLMNRDWVFKKKLRINHYHRH